jgi:glycine oxidase
MTRPDITVPDLTVRGGGIFGLSIAWAAVLRGAKVRVIETAQIGAGSSGGTVGALSPHTPENWNPKKAFQLESLLMAADFWAGVQAASGLPTGYARLGRVQPVDSAGMDLAQARGVTAQSLWAGQAHWRVRPRSGEWEPASDYVIEDTLSARLHPRLACAALAGALRAQGAEVILGEAENIGPVVWATGAAGLMDLSHDLGRNIGGAVKGQAISVRYDAANLPQLFVDSIHIVPHIDGTVAIGSTSENSYEDPLSTDAQLDALHARAIALLPFLRDAPIVDRWAGLRPRATTRAPLLGAWPNRAGHFVANGGFKIGFGMAPKVAQTMVDLVLDGYDTIPQGFRL